MEMATAKYINWKLEWSQYREIFAWSFIDINIFIYFVHSFRKRNGHIVDSKRDGRHNRMEGGDPENIALIIRDMTRHDMGNYTCELENEYGMGVSEDSIIVNVYCKYSPLIEIKHGPVLEQTVNGLIW